MKYTDNEIYHVYNRGAHKAPIFFLRDNYQYCLKLIQKYSELNGVGILAYCLMPNHFHLLLEQQSGGSISKFVQTTFNAYTQAVNKQQNHNGTLFQGKAKGRYIDSEEYALRIVRYLHINPVEAKLVVKPEEWEFSDYQVWIGTESNAVTNLWLRDAYFTTGKDYQMYIEQYFSEKEDLAEILEKK